MTYVNAAFVCDRCGLAMDVIETRARNGGSVRRRRACPGCGVRVTTIELPAELVKRAIKALRLIEHATRLFCAQEPIGKE